MTRWATLSALAELVGGRLLGDPELRITGVGAIEDAAPGTLTFLANPKYAPHLGTTRAGAVLLSESALGDKPEGLAAIVHERPDYAFALVAEHLLADPPPRPPGVHPTAVLGDGVRLGADVHVGPLAVIEEGASLGDRTVVGAASFVGYKARIGADCLLHPQVYVGHHCVLGDRVILQPQAVIGSDGFGYAEFPETIPEVAFPVTTWRKIPQLGNVVLQDEVEVGAGSTIDRARFGQTVIGAGTKIDNLCQIAHNVTIGKHGAMAAQCGIAGSSHLGHGVILAGQVGIVGHVTIDDAQIMLAKSGVTHSMRGAPGTQWQGRPTVPIRDFARQTALIHKLPQLLKRLKALEAEAAARRGD